MKIVHLCLACFFPDNYSYQENMLPKFHKESGHEVEVIASLATFDKNGKADFLQKGSVYQNEYSIKVTRLNYKKPIQIYRKLKRYIGTYHTLEKAQADILFIHGCQFMDMDIVVGYLNKHKNVKVCVDNHADFSNSATNWISKNILHKMLWRHTAHIIEPCTSKFYGVLPARVEFLKKIYKIPSEKCELLVMGADDEKVTEAKKPEKRQAIRNKYGIAEDDFLIVTGGKIDPWKMQTLLLMEAVKSIEHQKLKLIIFGSVTLELREKLEKLCVKDKIMYIGWVTSQDTYDYFASADLVVFPGRHSVFWEQVAGLGIPMICKYWEGTTHIDIGGNVMFIRKDSAEEIQKQIEKLLKCPEKYHKMLKVASSKGIKEFSYKYIAEKAIQL